MPKAVPVAKGYRPGSRSYARKQKRRHNQDTNGYKTANHSNQREASQRHCKPRAQRQCFAKQAE